MLEELARAMRIAADLPVFLWEQAVAHAAYVRNHTYTSAIKVEMPYQRWFNKKPDISHLQEFGAPVWILLQGQQILPKMEPKSKRRALVGYEDGSKSVIYYNAEMRKILISRNFCFLEPSTTTPEHLSILPIDEGESRKGAVIDTRTLDKSAPEPVIPLKRQAEENIGENSRETRGKRVDYRHLNDPWEDQTMHADELSNLLEGGNNQPTLEQARQSLEWPEWERVIQAELAQLRQKGTWKLVEKPSDAIPISNKWVLTKKRDKQGNVVKYKAHLVARGFTQCPGLDYDEMFSPVVQFEMIRALLALVASKKLKVRQLDVKGELVAVVFSASHWE